MRKVTDERGVKDIHLTNGSKFCNGETAEIKVQSFYEKLLKTADQEIIDLLGEVVGEPIPLNVMRMVRHI